MAVTWAVWLSRGQCVVVTWAVCGCHVVCMAGRCQAADVEAGGGAAD